MKSVVPGARARPDLSNGGFRLKIRLFLAELWSFMWTVLRLFHKNGHISVKKGPIFNPKPPLESLEQALSSAKSMALPLSDQVHLLVSIYDNKVCKQVIIIHSNPVYRKSKGPWNLTRDAKCFYIWNLLSDSLKGKWYMCPEKNVIFRFPYIGNINIMSLDQAITLTEFFKA